MGRGSTAAHTLLQQLRTAVGARVAICPISESIFLELFKQADLTTRRETALLIDELSHGVALIDPERRMLTEVAYFIHQADASAELYELDELVWTKVGYVLGLQHPVVEGFDSKLLFQFQQGCFDEIWGSSLASIVAAIGDAPLPDAESLSALAARLNRETPEHAGSLKSFQGTYQAEVFGGTRLVGRAIAEAVTVIGIRRGQLPSDVEVPSSEDPRLDTWKKLIATALIRDKGDARKVLRSIHIHAALHASHRWNKASKFSANDFYDFQHAAAALAYCDAFFTEKPLRTIIQQKHVALDRLYECTVASDLREASAWLEALAARN